MTQAIVRELPEPDAVGAGSRSGRRVDRVMHAEIRYWWLQGINRQGSAGLAKLGPIVVAVAAAFAGTAHVGALLRSTSSPSAVSGASTASSTSASPRKVSAGP